MTREYKPTKREKVLITILVIFLAGFFSGYFLFLPAMDRLSTNSEQLEIIQAVYESTKFEAGQSNIVKALADSQREKVIEARERLNDFTNIEIIEREFTMFMLQNDFVISSVAFSSSRGAVPAITLEDIPVLRAGTGELPADRLVSLTFTINAKSPDLHSSMRLVEYVNNIYSYRLTKADIQNQGMLNEMNNVTYTIEALLRTADNDGY